MRSKMKRIISREPPSRPARRPLDRVHFDLSPKLPVEGSGGYKGFLMIVDEFTGMKFVFLIRSKAEVPQLLRDFTVMAERHFAAKVAVLASPPRLVAIRSDSEAVNTSAQVQEWCTREGIRRETSVPYEQWQNGRAERNIGVSFEGAMAMLKAAFAPPQLWPLALQAFVATSNLLAIGASDLSPYELWEQHPIPLLRRIHHLRVWGCRAYVWVPAEQRKKGEDKAWVGVHVGYSSTSKAYRVLNLRSGKIADAVSVAFEENVFPLKAGSPSLAPVPSSSAVASRGGLPPAAPVSAPSSSVVDQERGGLLLPSAQDMVVVPSAHDMAVVPSAQDMVEVDPVQAEVPPGSEESSLLLPDGADPQAAPGFGFPHLEPSFPPEPVTLPVKEVLDYDIHRTWTPEDVENPFVEEGFKVRFENGRTSWVMRRDLDAPDLVASFESRPDVQRKMLRLRRRFPGKILGVNYDQAEASPHSSASEDIAVDLPALEHPPADQMSLLASLGAIAFGPLFVPRNVGVDGEVFVPWCDNRRAECFRLSQMIRGPAQDKAGVAALGRQVSLLAHSVQTQPTPKQRPYQVPRSFAEAMRDVNAEQWHEAMRAELASMEDFKVSELVPRPPGKNVMSCKWIFDIKRDAQGNVLRFKARLTARGFTQREGMDFGATWAPTCRLRVFRALIAEAASDPEMRTAAWDCTCAFLHALPDYEMFMEQPPGFEQGQGVWKLLKAIYGTKQASRLFHKMVRDALLQLGARQSKADECLFLIDEGRHKMRILVHVDDFAVTYNNRALYDRIFAAMQTKFKITDYGGGEITKFVGICVERTEDGHYRLHQRQYIEDLLVRLNLQDLKFASSPERAGTAAKLRPRTSLTADEQKFMDSVPYNAAVGALFYIARCTRFDISHASGQVARFMEKPAPEHWEAVLRIYRYLARTKDVALRMTGEGMSCDMTLEGMSDASWADCPETRRSHSGWLVRLGGCLVAWYSKRQDVIAQSSTESEYVSAASAANELVWWRRLLQELGLPVDGPITLWVDNASAVQLADHEGKFDAGKHIELRFHVLRDYHKRGIITVRWRPSRRQWADVLTKNCSAKHFLPMVSTILGENVQLSSQAH